MPLRTRIASLLVLAAGAIAATGSARGQEAATAPALVLELNGAQTSEKGCRLTFVVTNGLETELTKTAFEIALFDAKRVVDRLAVLDFQELPSGKTKVTRFDLPGVDCAGLSRILVNRDTECAGTGIEPQTCMRRLDPRSKAAIAFGL